jgi:hypothetical protein
MVAVVIGGAVFLLQRERFDDYFPTTPKGMTWKFRIRVSRPDRTTLIEEGEGVGTLLGEGSFEGQPAIVYEVRTNFQGAGQAAQAETVSRTYSMVEDDSIRTIGSERYRGTTLVHKIRYVPGFRGGQAPIKVGNSWSDDVQEISWSSTAGQREESRKIISSIKAREKAVVPAGTYDAVMIEREVGRVRHTEWRAKGKGMIKFVTILPIMTIEGELVEHLAK